ncbi:reverse transcriptase family protein, partial [Listeria welshimeri]|nr:reverse transcriptase family protein [Listeria welshimeri]
IPPIVLKTCAPELTSVLTRLFTLSYSKGVVPTSWKVALVHPIPKKGDSTDPSNYRPIAITSILSKVMEQVINAQLLGYLEDHQLISDRQYGFRHGRSAGDLLVYLSHRWATAIESKGEAMAVSLDIAKAFDRVWHKALLMKLPSYGLSEGLCRWVTSFLNGRSIKVVVDGTCSDTKPINAGVPQGSVLSPTLFILHINDMLQTSNMHCYADDSTGDAIYTGRANIPRSEVEEYRKKLVLEIETSLEQVSEWGRQNLVLFNPSKTQVCAFTAKKTPFI